MKEKIYTITKTMMRNPTILKTEPGDDFEISNETHEKDAATLCDFIYCEIPADTLRILKTKLERANWWDLLIGNGEKEETK